MVFLSETKLSSEEFDRIRRKVHLSSGIGFNSNGKRGGGLVYYGKVKWMWNYYPIVVT